MDSTIYKKTPKGFEEIETGRHGLTRKMRLALILVDGQTPLAVLRGKIAALGDTENIVENLSTGGFIEAINKPPVAPSVQTLAKPKTEQPRPAEQPEHATCPLHKPGCIGDDCMMSYGCSARKKHKG